MERERMPRDEPKGWVGNRRLLTWTSPLLTIVAAIFTQWLARIVGGAVVGASSTPVAIFTFIFTDFDDLNRFVAWSSTIVTVVIVTYVMMHIYNDMTWSEHQVGTPWGIDWWPTFWRPILIGALCQGTFFAVYMHASID